MVAINKYLYKEDTRSRNSESLYHRDDLSIHFLVAQCNQTPYISLMIRVHITYGWLMRVPAVPPKGISSPHWSLNISS